MKFSFLNAVVASCVTNTFFPGFGRFSKFLGNSRPLGIKGVFEGHSTIVAAVL